MAKIKNIIGCDEVGYGALAGPLVVAAVSADENWSIPGLNDSKKLTDKQRRELSDKLWDCHFNTLEISIHIVEAPNILIDSHGVYPVLKNLYRDATKALYHPNDTIIIDGNVNFDEVLAGMNYQTVVKADSKYPTVMAASIVAKVYRDNIMIKLSEQCPEYDWASNKGYGSAKHIDAIHKIGYSGYHRLSYKLKDDDQARKTN